jgi:hypothetical protein
MYDALTPLHARLRRESFATLAGDFEKTGFLGSISMIGLPYGLLGCGLWL